MAAASPSSSPRLPSPPPMAEDQVSPSRQDEHGQLGATISAINDSAASRRIRPGTKAEDMVTGPPLIPLTDIDSAFQLTEHLKALHNSHTHPTDSPYASETAIDKATALSLATAPPGIDRGIWLYELCRFLTQQANAMVIALFSDDPACSAATCPEMRASEWQYLCAAHEPPKSCCAIDYCCHTLDWCATALTSTKLFPSRLSLGTEAISAQMQIRKMTEVFRRVYRIFAHAWFSHREAFWRIETKTGLYLFFKTVCDEYRLIQEDNYTIPPEAEGIVLKDGAQQGEPLTAAPPPSLLRRDTVKQLGEDGYVASKTTRKHRHSLSTASDRSASVSTVIHEEVEEDDDDDWIMKPEHEVEGETTVVLIEDDTETAGAASEHGETTEDETENEREEEHEDEDEAEAGIEGATDAPTVTITAPEEEDREEEDQQEEEGEEEEGEEEEGEEEDGEEKAETIQDPEDTPLDEVTTAEPESSEDITSTEQTAIASSSPSSAIETTAPEPSIPSEPIESTTSATEEAHDDKEAEKE